MRIGTISATGVGAQAVVINDNVGGSVDISQGVVATGYRSTSRSTNPALSVLYTPDEMQQGGAAVTIGGNLGNGLIISAPPPILSTSNLDLDGNGVPDTLQGKGIVNSFGSSPAIQIGAVASGGGTAPNITLGAFSNAAISGYGFVVQGTVAANGLFDQLTTPNLPAPVAATAIQIGGPILITPPVSVTVGGVTTVTPAVFEPSGTVNIVGGLYNSGTISAASYQGDATAIRVGAGGIAPTIHNDGSIFAVSTQVNSATTVTVNGSGIPSTPAPVPVAVTAIAIDPGGSVTTIANNSGITAEISGTGGVGGAATAIIDKSGTLQNIQNTGSIVAELNQNSGVHAYARRPDRHRYAQLDAGPDHQPVDLIDVSPIDALCRHQFLCCGLLRQLHRRQHLSGRDRRRSGLQSHQLPKLLASGRRAGPVHHRRHLFRRPETTRCPCPGGSCNRISSPWVAA